MSGNETWGPGPHINTYQEVAKSKKLPERCRSSAVEVHCTSHLSMENARGREAQKDNKYVKITVLTDCYLVTCKLVTHKVTVLKINHLHSSVDLFHLTS